jgi:hypothetical protein
VPARELQAAGEVHWMVDREAAARLEARAPEVWSLST